MGIYDMRAEEAGLVVNVVKSSRTRKLYRSMILNIDL